MVWDVSLLQLKSATCMIMRRNAEKNDNLRKLMKITIERKSFKDDVGIQNFQELEAGEGPNFLKLK